MNVKLKCLHIKSQVSVKRYVISFCLKDFITYENIFAVLYNHIVSLTHNKYEHLFPLCY